MRRSCVWHRPMALDLWHMRTQMVEYRCWDLVQSAISSLPGQWGDSTDATADGGLLNQTVWHGSRRLESAQPSLSSTVEDLARHKANASKVTAAGCEIMLMMQPSVQPSRASKALKLTNGPNHADVNRHVASGRV